MADIRTIESYTLRAWPALETRHYDGWVLRFSGGYTRRANSVNPIYGSTLDIDEKIDFCESLYGESIYFKMTESVYPGDLDDTLDARGYTKVGDVMVKLRDLSNLTDAIDYPESVQLECTEQINNRWLRTFTSYGEIEPRYVSVMRHMLSLIPGKSGYFSLLVDGEPVAVGLGVVDGDYASLFDVVTVPAHRKKGYGELLVKSIMQWGKANGAKNVFLQVVGDNEPAQALYEKLGFHTAYRYWYRYKSVE